MTLQEIKDQVARDAGRDDWNDLTSRFSNNIHEYQFFINKAASRYAFSVAKEFRNKIIKDVNLPPRKEEAVLSMDIELP